MNWEAIGATAEILGVATVIASIFYLALQVKHGISVAQGSARQAVSQLNIDALAASLDSQVVSNACRKSTVGDALTPEEYSNYIRWVAMRMRVCENAHYQYQKGLLGDDIWRGYTHIIKGQVGSGTVAESYWKKISVAYSPDFVDEVNRLIRDH